MVPRQILRVIAFLPEHTKVLIVVPDTRQTERFTIVTGVDGPPIIRTTNDVITSQLVRELETQTP